MLPAIALGLALAFAPAAHPAAAASAPVGSASAPADTARSRIVVVGGDSLRTPAAGAADSTTAPRWTSQPRVVMLRSLLLPGWGQLHNHAYVKAVAVAAAEGALIGSAIADQHSLPALRDSANAAGNRGDATAYALAAKAYNARLDRLVGHQWMLGGVLAYALVDAYVDAHFRNFDIEFRNDPALTPAGGQPSSAVVTPVSRLALRWTF